MRTSHASAIDVGQVRDHQEDALLADPPVFVIADGMGGHAAGEVASGMVIEHLQTYRQGLLDGAGADPAGLRAAVEQANSLVYQHAQENPDTQGMGSTISGLVLDEAQVLVVNVGDSRTYRWRQGALTQITTDHSEVQELVAAGVLTAEDAWRHPLGNVITRCVGVHEQVRVDVTEVPVAEGDLFVVCSDGLSGELRDEQLAGLLRVGGDLPALADSLVQAALAAGGRDNISVILVRIDA